MAKHRRYHFTWFFFCRWEYHGRFYFRAVWNCGRIMATTFTLIQTYTIGSGGTSTVTFSSIPTTGIYTDLVLKCSARSTNASTYNTLGVIFNSDSTSSYSYRMAYGDGSTATSASQPSNTKLEWFYANGNSTTANTFANCEMYIPNAFGSTYKSVSIDSVVENNATAVITDICTGLWSNTAAINRMDITINAGLIAEYSTFSLYGILKA